MTNNITWIPKLSKPEWMKGSYLSKLKISKLSDLSLYKSIQKSQFQNHIDKNTKSYSKLSSTDVELTTQHDDKESLSLTIGNSVSRGSGIISKQLQLTLLAWLSMFLAVLSGSSIGPIFKFMSTHGIHPMQSASWRCQCMLIFLIPLAIVEIVRQKPHEKVTWFEKRPGLQFPVYVHVLIAGLVWAGNLLTWIVGLQFTTTVRAAIFCNVHPLILVLVFYFTGKHVSGLEWLGVIVAIIGVCVSAEDGITEILHGSHSSDAARTLFGDVLCVFAGVNEVVIILNRHRIKPYVPLMQYTCITTAIVAVTASIASMLFEVGVDHVFCLADSCIFGWASHKWLRSMLLFGLYIGLFCISGFNYAMQYISPLIFSSISLIDPALTGVISWVAGLEGIPDLQTWIGGAIVIAGVGAVTIGEHLKSSSTPSHDNDEVVSEDDVQYSPINKIDSIKDQGSYGMNMDQLESGKDDSSVDTGVSSDWSDHDSV